MSALSERLKKTKGKKIYGYLSRDIKDMVDDIVDELAKDETIAELYDLWYEKERSFTLAPNDRATADDSG